MANVVKDRSFTENLIDTLSIPGALVRQFGIDVVEGKRSSLGDYADIVKKDKRVEPANLVDSIEERTGLDLTPGGERWDDKNMGEKAATIGRDFVIDLFTSPDSLIAAPAKMAAASKAMKAISNPVARKAAERAIVGATYGALAIDSDDDVLDAVAKIGMGTFAAPTIARGVEHTAGKVGGFLSKNVMDPIVESYNKPIIEQAKIQLGEQMAKEGASAAEIAKAQSRVKFSRLTELERGTQRTIRQFERAYLNDMKQIEGDIIQILNSSDATPEGVKSFMNKYDDIIGEGKSTIISSRNALLKIANARKQSIVDPSIGIDEGLFKQGFGELKQTFERIYPKNPRMVNEQMTRTLGSLRKNIVNEKNLETLAKENGKELFDKQIFRIATETANDISLNHVDELVRTLPKDVAEVMYFGMNRHIEMGHDMIGRYNNYVRNRFGQSYEVVPFMFHKTDLSDMKQLTDLEEMQLTMREGAQMAKSPKVTVRREGISREKALEIGANRYARMFLTREQNQARQILAEIRNNVGKSNEPVIEMFRGYDNLLKFMKSVVLTTGHNWIVNNLPDNVAKAYMAAGPDAASIVAAKSSKGMAYAVGNAVNAKALSKLDDNYYTKMAQIFSPDDQLKKIDYDAQWLQSGKRNNGNDLLNAASDLGVIDNTRMDDFKDIVANNEALKNLTPNMGEGAEKIFRDGWRGALDKTYDVMGGIEKTLWDKVGRVGVTAENIARMETFKHVMDTFKDEALYKGGVEAIEKYGASRVLSDSRLLTEIGKENKMFKKVVAGRRLMRKAANVTNNAFFDYQNVNAFERHVMKRIFPFWSFRSKNLQFWTDAVLDPNQIERVANVARVPRALGRGPTERERLGTPDYLLERGVRFRDSGSTIDAATFPNLSLFDATTIAPVPGQLDRSLDAMLNSMAPIPKQLVQQGLNVDLFTGDKLAPDANRPKKRIFESWMTAYAPDSWLEKVGLYRDKNGNIFTNRPATARTVSFIRDIIPFPTIADSVARGIRDVRFRDKGSVETAVDQLLPVKDRDLKRSRIRKSGRNARRNIKRLRSGKKRKVLGKGRN